MGSRTTRSQVESLFRLLCGKLGPIAVGWELDHNSAYGGYYITSNKGSELPFGAQRRSAGEMWSAMRFALDALIYSLTEASTTGETK